MKANMRICRLLLGGLLLSLVLLSMTRLLFERVAASTDPTTAHPGMSLQFQAVRRAEGIWLEWQVSAAAPWAAFRVYHSQDCQWENATLVAAPIFSSMQHDADGIAYSLLDEGVLAAPPCAYWIVGTQASGVEQIFGPTPVQNNFGIYLPVVYR